MTTLGTRCWAPALLAALALACKAPREGGPPRPAGSARVLGPLDSDGSPRRLPPGPPAEPPFTLVFRYDDFGPDVMARELLGPQWWSWARACCFEPNDKFDIRVVVYRDRALADVRARYPTIENESDYRYVERDAALRYLDGAIADLSPDEDEEWPHQPALRRRLEETRAAILDRMGHVPARAAPRASAAPAARKITPEARNARSYGR